MTNPYAVDLSSWIFLTFLIGTALSSMLSSILDWLGSEKGNITEKTRKLHSLNPLLKKHFTRQRINKALKYNEEGSRFSDFMDSLGSGAASVAILLGLIPMTLDFLLRHGFGMTTALITISTTAMIVSTALTIPFSMYNTFSIEERNGFNRTTKRTFFMDIAKSTVLGCLVNAILIFVGNQIFTNIRFSYSNVAYLIVGILIFQMMMECVSFQLMKMFNSFTPLKDKTLLKKLEKTFSTAGYRVKNVLVMDGSRRSTHSNAFVCGVGKSKKIVLFDTLLKKFTPDEIVSILAHEIGHARKGHLLLNRIMGMTLTSVFMILAISFLYDANLYRSFGFSYVTQENVQMFSLLGLTLVTMTLKPIKTILINPFEAFISRKMEYQADSEARRYMKTGKHLASSLIKISSENLSDPFPSPFVESMTYDHPSLVNRLKALGETNVSKSTAKTTKKTVKTAKKAGKC